MVLDEDEEGVCVGVDDHTCSIRKKVSVPDYMIIMSEHEAILREELQVLNMVQVGRYAHTLAGLRIGSVVIGRISAAKKSRRMLQVNFDEMVLLKKDSIHASR